MKSLIDSITHAFEEVGQLRTTESSAAFEGTTGKHSAAFLVGKQEYRPKVFSKQETVRCPEQVERIII